MQWNSLTKAVLCFLLAGAAGCRQGPALDIAVTGEMTSLTVRTPRQDDPSIFNSETHALSLFSAANETVSFQIVLDSGPAGLEQVRLNWTPLNGPEKAKIGPENIRAFRMLPVTVSEYPAWYLRLVDKAPEVENYYDALAPIDDKKNGQPFDLPPNQRLALWVDVYVPRDARAGQYAGKLTVTASKLGELAAATIPNNVPRTEWNANVSLKVYDFVLGDAKPLAAVGGFDHKTLFGTFIQREGQPFAPDHLDRTEPMVRHGLEIMRQLMLLSYQHRLDLFDKTLHPAMKRKMNGEISLDWTDYDAIVTPYLTGSAFNVPVGCSAWPLPLSADWPRARDYGGDDADEYLRTMRTILAASWDHFKQIKAVKQAFFWPYRGEVSLDAYAMHTTLAAIARSIDPAMQILAVLPPKPPAMTNWSAPVDFAKLADIFAPPGQWLDPNLAVHGNHPLAGAWLAPGQPPYVPSLDVSATPADARALPWLAMKYGCTGLLLNEVLNWSGDCFKSPAGAATRLFYPGISAGFDQVLPSVRLKRLRRGLQDIAYIHILQQRGKSDVARAIMSAMAHYAALGATGDNYLDVRLNGWEQDGESWEIARRVLAEQVQAAVHSEEKYAHSELTEQTDWARLQQRTQRLQVEQIRTRVTLASEASKDKTDRLQAMVSLDLYNGYSHAVDGNAGLGVLPQRWSSLGEAGISKLAPGQKKTVTLKAEGDYVPGSSNAKMLLPLSVKVGARESNYVALVPFLVSGRIRTAPTIDGQLADWPTHPGNAAGDFRLLGRRGESGNGLAKRQTAVFVQHDRKNLYIGIRCEEPNPNGITVKGDNLVRYQQLMACGEELVEIILDPGFSAKGPEDLYHMVIKPTGVIVAERGVGCNPPLGKVQPWPVSATVAVSRGPDVWVVEMAIPLSAFGPDGAREFWGANFARYASQGQESSNWAGAPRYYYDPRNMGTMYLPPEPKKSSEK